MKTEQIWSRGKMNKFDVGKKEYDLIKKEQIWSRGKINIFDARERNMIS